MIITEFFSFLLQSFLSSSPKKLDMDKRELPFQSIIGDRLIEDLEFNNKNDCIRTLVKKLCDSDSTLKHNIVLNAVLEREKISHTSLNNEIAIPHCRLNVPSPIGIIGTFKKGESIHWTNDDNELPVRIVCILVSPIENPELHVNAIKTIIQQLKNSNK